MPITELDIKLRKSQRLTDNPDGGGRMVQAEVVDGAMNNLFPDIGDEERTTGRSTLRKAFVHIDTSDADVLKDAIGIIIKGPQDSHVNVSMFSTGSYSDVRETAKNRVESYVTKGTESRYILFGDHFVGQQTLRFYCMKDAPTPEINDTLCLSTDAAGYVSNEQYMKVKSILLRQTETFYDDTGAFERDVIVVETVTALIYDFFGQEATRRTSVKPPTRVYETNNIDANNYYSVKNLTADAEIGDLSVKVDSPYVPIVPSTLAETPVVDILAGLGTVSYVQSGDTDALSRSFNSSFAAGVAVTSFLGNPIAKGSVKVTAGSVELTDDGSGNLSSGALSPWGGSVDYGSGSVSVTHENGTGSTSIAILATPAAPIVDQGYTDRLGITSGNQGYNYIVQLEPLPAPGTVVVDYRALGRWIRLIDNGTGQLVGRPGQGSGSINYATGSVIVTTGALPDVDSHLLTSWGTGVVTERRDDDSDIQTPYLNFLLPHEGIVPGSYEATWLVAAAPVVATDNGAGVLLVGVTPVGTIVYATGEVGIRPPILPDASSLISSEYEWSLQVENTFTPVPDGGGIAGFTLATHPVRAGSIRLSWLVSAKPFDDDLGTVTVALTMQAKDDGAGNIVAVSAGGRSLTTTLGTVNYTTGVVSMKVGLITLNNFPIPTYADTGTGAGLRFNGKTRTTVATTFSPGTTVSAGYQAAAAADNAATDEIALPPVAVDLTPGITDSIVPGSVRFTFKGHVYVDRNGGLYRDIDPVTGAGTYAGTVDYASGKATLSSWVAGGTNAITIASLLTRMYDPGTDGLFFRTPGSPLRPGSFTLRATTLEGDLVTGTADISGNITGDLMEGFIDWDSGAAEVRFGEYVTAAGNEGEPWYDPDNVVGPNVWRPHLMIAGSIFLGTVVYRSIPLSAIVVGLDPIRLPSDGRVPIFKAGNTILIHHSLAISVASPVAGASLDLERDRIAQIEVRDSLGVPIQDIWYTYDLDAGTFEWADPLNLSAYTLPAIVTTRIEDRRLVAGVQITGEVELNTGLSHDFPADETLVSTALRLGEANGSLDLQARVENLFDQNTWTSVWSNALIGSAAGATYNDTDFPLVVENEDAITERWALVFTSATNFSIVGESVGTIGSGTTLAGAAPLNPRTSEPYFTILPGGFGSGWATSNVIRFNTVGAIAPVWFVRTTLAGSPETVTDSFRFQVVGNSAGVTP